MTKRITVRIEVADDTDMQELSRVITDFLDGNVEGHIHVDTETPERLTDILYGIVAIGSIVERAELDEDDLMLMYGIPLDEAFMLADMIEHEMEHGEVILELLKTFSAAFAKSPAAITHPALMKK